MSETRTAPRTSRLSLHLSQSGVFAQDDIQAARWLTLSLGARADFHSQYGVLYSPRFAALMRGHGWTSRLSLGQGFSTPSALTEDTEAAGLRRVTVIQPLSLWSVVAG
jgi:outer membrane receptor for ferrienterochelin and colicin